MSMQGTYERLGVHIYASDREVIRKMSKRMIPYRPADRVARRALFRRILACHHQARALAREFRL